MEIEKKEKKFNMNLMIAFLFIIVVFTQNFVVDDKHVQPYIFQNISRVSNPWYQNQSVSFSIEVLDSKYLIKFIPIKSLKFLLCNWIHDEKSFTDISVLLQNSTTTNLSTIIVNAKVPSKIDANGHYYIKVKNPSRYFSREVAESGTFYVLSKPDPVNGSEIPMSQTQQQSTSTTDSSVVTFPTSSITPLSTLSNADSTSSSFPEPTSFPSSTDPVSTSSSTVTDSAFTSSMIQTTSTPTSNTDTPYFTSSTIVDQTSSIDYNGPYATKVAQK